ncbi:MAG TPA: phosphoserine phosphatase SerB [Methylophilaceae bacterium]|nr:phosphoserine phosphatase SerB [Methylophilaceae bacterium]HQR61205.1 phosphoserine phosphatase SerB [Methylophilaceae bacterium]
MRLVIQGPTLGSLQLQKIAGLCGSSQFTELESNAYSLRGDFPGQSEIKAYCSAQGIDCAFVPDGQVMENFGLVVMDMDSTLISIECIDEIADMQGLKPQVAAITESAMRGEIEFAESLRRRVALLQGLDESALQRVYDERLQLNPGAQKLIDTLKERTIKTLLVSGGFNYFTDGLKQRLGLDYALGNRLEIVDGKLTGQALGDIIDAQGKADWLARTRDALGLRKEQVIAIGDGANDLKMMAAAGVGIAYHAKPVVREQATYALNHVGLDGVLNLFRS